MALPQSITVKESVEEIKLLLSKASRHLLPRLKMLQYLAKGVYSIDALASKVGSSRNAVASWKRLYKTGGLDALCADKRGGDYRSGIDAAGKAKIAAKLADPKNAFTSFGRSTGMDKSGAGYR